jgi:hypothetical protein
MSVNALSVMVTRVHTSVLGGETAGMNGVSKVWLQNNLGNPPGRCYIYNKDDLSLQLRKVVCPASRKVSFEVME